MRDVTNVWPNSKRPNWVMTHDIDLGEGGGENKVAPKNLIWMSNTHAILFSNAKYTNEINTVCLTLMVGMFTMPHARTGVGSAQRACSQPEVMVCGNFFFFKNLFLPKAWVGMQK